MYITSSDDPKRGLLLTGTAISSDSIVRGTRGLRDYLSSGGNISELCEGRFLLQYQTSEGNTRLRVDSGGAELLFIYRSRTGFAASNSLLGLLEAVKKRGWKLTLNPEVLAGVFVRASLYEQPTSEALAFREVEMVPAGMEVEVTPGQLRLVPSPPRRPGWGKYATSFEEAAIQWTGYYRGVIDAIQSVLPTNLELSGGADSRVILGLTMDHVRARRVRVSTSRQKQNDYTIASSLASIFGFDTTAWPNGNVGTSQTAIKYRQFCYANIGVCRTERQPDSNYGTAPSTVARINGGGGEVGRAFFNTDISAYFRLLDRHDFNPHIRMLMKSSLEDQLDKREYQTAPITAMADLYRDFRNRTLGGRAWYKELLGVTITPYLGSYFEYLSRCDDLEKHFSTSRDDVYKRGLIHLSLLSLTAPDLAVINHDNYANNYDLSDVSRIRKWAERARKQLFVSRFNVHGTFSTEWEPGTGLPHTTQDRAGDFESLSSEDIKQAMPRIKQLDILDLSWFEDLNNSLENDRLTSSQRISLTHAAHLVHYVS